ncbi:hypothetical protein [Peribacillus loiseleuriae]|nr:hypothetical protein [Peribacillus loiseleuriae]
MTPLQGLIIILAAGILGIVVDKLIKKIFNIEQRKGRSYVYANKIHQWGE